VEGEGDENPRTMEIDAATGQPANGRVLNFGSDDVAQRRALALGEQLLGHSQHL
jgi:hypothetical protein